MPLDKLLRRTIEYRHMRKLIVFASILVAALLVCFLWNSPKVTEAGCGGCGDPCGYIHTYKDKTSDFSDTRVSIDFSDYQDPPGSGNAGYYQITVSAQSGYKVNHVWLDVHDDGQSGYYLYADGPLSNFNPDPGKQINEAKVEVERVCASPSPTATATPTSSPTASPTESPSPTASPTETPIETASPVPTESATPEPTPAPTTPSCGSDEHLDLSGTKCLKWELGGPPPPPSVTGQVLGASTMAGTGVAEDTLFSLIFILGCLATSLGIRKVAAVKA